MWLLDTHTLLHHRVDSPSAVTYAILSHVWSKSGEKDFQQLRRIQEETQQLHERKRFYDRGTYRDLLRAHRQRIPDKVWKACEVARRDGYRYLWIDASCIDKTSSAELSEAINSMYAWYAGAAVCYAFLHDVDDDEDPAWEGSSFRGSEWFTRGWTLQELIAPRIVVFLSKNWSFLGTKESLSEALVAVTNIHPDVLAHRTPLDDVSVGERMTWASGRRTTRPEDEAYCLMGIFGVNMPTIYGEGRQAFQRLQEEILKRIPDPSLFLWGRHLQLKSTALYTFTPNTASACSDCSLLAGSPQDFAQVPPCRKVELSELSLHLGVHVPPPVPPPEYMVTAYGIRARLPLATVHTAAGPIVVAILSCKYTFQRRYGFVALILQSSTVVGELSLVKRGAGVYFVGRSSLSADTLGALYYRHTTLARETFSPSEPVHVEEVYLVHRGTEHSSYRERRSSLFLTVDPFAASRPLSLVSTPSYTPPETPSESGRPKSSRSSLDPRAAPVPPFKILCPPYLRRQVHQRGYTFIGNETMSFTEDDRPGEWRMYFCRPDAPLKGITICLHICDCPLRSLCADVFFHGDLSRSPPPRQERRDYCAAYDRHVVEWRHLSKSFYTVDAAGREVLLRLRFRRISDSIDGKMGVVGLHTLNVQLSEPVFPSTKTDEERTGKRLLKVLRFGNG
ncbi:heterokaryon incompatibility protein-domain-containing protein [Trametes maxima]|nr:heterokaryon incompatibility protein-domain-containing protein [Trametes maxima]